MCSRYPLSFDPDRKLISRENRKVCLTNTGDFLKAHEVSPDGNIVLTSSESNYMCSWRLPNATVQKSMYYEPSAPPALLEVAATDDGSCAETALLSAIPVGEAVHDFKWYPHMSLAIDGSSCFITCSRDHPVQLWDLNSGALRGSYVGHNHLDELETSNSVAFNMQGDKIFSGANRMIRCFDVNRPGKDCLSMATSKTKKDKTGQKGIISDLRFNPQRINLYAAGSYAHSIGLYAEHESSAAKSCLMHISGLPFGVTCLRWSPCGNLLWVGGRKSDAIICYDIRNSCEEVGRIHRPLASNQRMQFAVDLWGNTIATGTEDGRLLVYDTHSFEIIYQDEISNHCVNCVSFHPFSSLLIATTGQRNFDIPMDEGDQALAGTVDIDNITAYHSQSSHIDGKNENGQKSFSAFFGEEKWSELQVYGLYTNEILLQQLFASYSQANPVNVTA